MDSPVSKKQNPVFRTLSYILPYWYLILAATIGGVLKLTLPLVVPQMLRYFTDNLLPPENLMPVSQKMRIVFWSMILILAIYLFVYIPATYIREVGSLRVSNHIIHKMRCQLYDRLIRMSAGFHNENASGQLVSRINSDVEKVHDFIWSVATNVWIDSIMFAIYMALMIPINPGLTLLVSPAIFRKGWPASAQSACSTWKTGKITVSGSSPKRFSGRPNARIPFPPWEPPLTPPFICSMKLWWWASACFPFSGEI